MSGYGGESPAKKVARLEWWKAIHKTHPSLLTSRIVVLAGPGAGDARVLRGLGADMSRVTMVDMDAAALESARAIVPEARAFLGTDLDAAVSMRGKVDVVALDYCMQLSAENIAKFGRVSAVALRSFGGVAACGMSYGRESGERLDAVNRGRGYWEQTSAYTEHALAGKRGAEAKKIMNRAARYSAFSDAARRGLGAVSLRFEERWFRFYQSATDTKVGTPMMYAVGTAKRGARCYETIASLAGKRARHVLRETFAEAARDDKWARQSLNQSRIPAGLLDAVADIHVRHDGLVDFDDCPDVRTAAVRAARTFGSRVTADLLALDDADARRVPAWVAVDTREQRRSA